MILKNKKIQNGFTFLESLLVLVLSTASVWALSYLTISLNKNSNRIQSKAIFDRAVESISYWMRDEATCKKNFVDANSSALQLRLKSGSTDEYQDLSITRITGDGDRLPWQQLDSSSAQTTLDVSPQSLKLTNIREINSTLASASLEFSRNINVDTLENLIIKKIPIILDLAPGPIVTGCNIIGMGPLPSVNTTLDLPSRCSLLHGTYSVLDQKCNLPQRNSLSSEEACIALGGTWNQNICSNLIERTQGENEIDRTKLCLDLGGQFNQISQKCSFLLAENVPEYCRLLNGEFDERTGNCKFESPQVLQGQVCPNRTLLKSIRKIGVNYQLECGSSVLSTTITSTVDNTVRLPSGVGTSGQSTSTLSCFYPDLQPGDLCTIAKCDISHPILSLVDGRCRCCNR